MPREFLMARLFNAALSKLMAGRLLAGYGAAHMTPRTLPSDMDIACWLLVLVLLILSLRVRIG